MKKLMTVIAAVATGLAALTGGAAASSTALPENVFDATKVTAVTDTYVDTVWTNGWDGADVLTNSEKAVLQNNASSEQVLHIETGNTPLSRLVKGDGSSFSVSDKVYFDVQADLLGQVLDDVPLTSLTDATTKFALFMLDGSLVEGLENKTNLCAIVRDPSESSSSARALVMFEPTDAVKLLLTGKARVTVQGYANVMNSDNTASMGFRVYVGGEEAGDGEQQTYPDALKIVHLYKIADGALVKQELTEGGYTCEDKMSTYTALKSMLNTTLAESYESVLLSLADTTTEVGKFDLVGNADVSTVTINDTGFKFISSDTAQATIKWDNDIELTVTPKTEGANIFNAETGIITGNATIKATIKSGSSKSIIKVTPEDATYLTPVDGEDNTWTYTFAKNNDVTFEAFAAAVTIVTTDGETATTNEYSSMAEAIDVISGLTGTAKITLGQPAYLESPLTCGSGDSAVITLDLNGQMISVADTEAATAVTDAGCVILAATGKTTIIDSSSQQTGRIVAPTDVAAVAVNEAATLDIQAGTYEGAVKFYDTATSATATLSISGGSFRAAENSTDENLTAFALTDSLADNCAASKSGDYWVVVSSREPVITYTVTFVNEKAETTTTTQEVKKNSDNKYYATAPETPKADGFKFLGWFAEDAEAAFDFEATEISANITLTAKWAQLVTLTVEADANVTSYKITDADSTEITLDENKKAQFVATDKKVVKATDIVYAEGYEADADNSTLSVTMDSDQTITIKSKATTPVSTTYTVTFVTAYGTAPDAQTVEANGNAKKPEGTLTADDYVFAYWYGEDENTAFDFETTAIISNITLTAKWNAKGWADYLGGDVDSEGYYVIDSEAEFKAFADHAQTLGTAGLKFALGNDIALTVTDATAANTIGIGIQNFKDSVKPEFDTFKSKAFGGEFDGRGHTISNVILPCTDYAGLFMSAYNATIKNLNVSLGNATGYATPADSSVEYGGGVIVGIAKGTTISNCSTVVADGHNTLKAPKALAGIVGFFEGGTVLKACTNNLNIVSDNAKCGGLVSIVQCLVWDVQYGSITDCANFGSVTSGKGTAAYAAGFASYVTKGYTLTIGGTCVQNGAVTTGDNCASIVSSYNCDYIAIADGAVISTTQTTQKSTNLGNCDGLNFAKIEDGVATFVKNAAAQANGASTKVMVGGQTLTLSTVGDSITLDQSMATATVTKNAETYPDADYEIKETKVSDNVTTYTLAAIVKTWADYLGAAVNDVYEIDNLTELLAFQAQAKTLGTKDISFALTTDIALTDPWDGVGLYSDTSYAFEGTFNGRGHTISNLVFSNLSTGNNYRGFFGRVKDGVIKNLTIDGKGFVSDVTDEYGCALFVGVMTTSAKSGETPVSAIENCVAKGSISATHNAAGFAVKVVAGTFKGCTNQVAITATSKKVGGIVGFAQANQDDGLSMKVNFIDCANEGAVSVTGAGEGVGGILGYVTVIDLTIENCVNKAAITNSGTGTVGQIAGLANNNVTPSGTNKVLADTLTVGSYTTGMKMDGTSYASLPADDDNLVTLVKDSALALDSTYKVMVTGRSYTMSEVGSITFDQSLATVSVTKADSLSDDDGYSLTTVTNQDNSITYTVAKAAAVDPIPAGTSKTDYNDADAAQKAAEAINADKASLITIPNAETLNLSTEQKTAYDNLFVATANGTTVTVDFTEEATNTLAAAAEKIVESLDLQTFAASTSTEAQSLVTITDATPGLYYTLLSGTETPANLPTATSVQATSTGKVEFKLTKPGDKAFFKVVISAQEIHSTGLGE